MNILPLIAAFVLLFALGSYTFVHQFRAIREQESYFRAAMRIDQQLHTTLTRADFDRIKGKKLFVDKKETAEKQQKETVYRSPRQRFNLYASSKLNLMPLVKIGLVDREKDQLMPLAERVLLRMYEGTKIYRAGLEKRILEIILETIKKNPSIKNFEDFYIHLDKEKPLFYKLLKGTHRYHLSSKIGYPALTDFLTLSPNTADKAVNLPDASLLVLAALFGDGVAHQIIDREKEKWEKSHKHEKVSKQELTELLLKERKNISDFERLIDMNAHKKTLAQFVFYDQKSGMQVKIPK